MFLFGNADGPRWPEGLHWTNCEILNNDLPDHNKSEEKDFWDRVLIRLCLGALIANDALLTRSFLEWHCASSRHAKQVAILDDLWKQRDAPAHATTIGSGLCWKCLRQRATLLATLGQPLVFALERQ